MSLQGWIQQQAVLMLVESRSSQSFVSSSLAAKHIAHKRNILPLNVKVANGELLQCAMDLVNYEWWTQGYRFYSNFKILPLVSYDPQL
jgi:hypothetical protein